MANRARVKGLSSRFNASEQPADIDLPAAMGAFHEADYGLARGRLASLENAFFPWHGLGFTIPNS